MSLSLFFLTVCTFSLIFFKILLYYRVFYILSKLLRFPHSLRYSLWQDLLQLQYEGVAVMKLFDRAKVNVNLLIFLLNKKFYGK